MPRFDKNADEVGHRYSNTSATRLEEENYEVGHRYSNTSAMSFFDKNADEVGHRYSNTSAMSFFDKNAGEVGHQYSNTSATRLDKENDDELAIVTQTLQVDLKRTMMKLLIYTQVVKVFQFNYDYGVKSSLWICYRSSNVNPQFVHNT
jgi:hypothetical protein